ncbi:MAG: DUF5680 domain-containing protein [Candidatus Micrarchaeales archaeon]|nr:DUF5680 domain-containing protein [Candidatus Micrarchaeales archaeon]
MKLNSNSILGFLNGIEGWADPDAKESTPRPGLKVITIKKGNWTYMDQYAGGEPFQGLEIVWLKKVPVWSMSYRGFWNEGSDYKIMLKFVKKALQKPPKNAPWRGPKRFTIKDIPDWGYTNKWQGTIKEFNGLEKILFRGKVKGWTVYQGGIVNKKHINL